MRFNIQINLLLMKIQMKLQKSKIKKNKNN